MELLDRYLQAVRFWLPKAQQDDIIAELSEDIHSEIEEREASLGHKLNEAELAALLRQRGRPLLVANKYLPQQALIGSALFPTYKLVLKIVALCYSIPWILTGIALVSFDSKYRATYGILRGYGRIWAPFWSQAFFLFAAVTIVFVALERMQAKNKFLDKWDPLKLPAYRDPNPITRFDSAVELGADFVFVVWWFTRMSSPTIFNREGVRITLGSWWHSFYWIFFAFALANIAVAGWNLFVPYWTSNRAWIRLALNAATSATVCWVFRVNLLAQIAAPNLPAAKAIQIVETINAAISRCFPFAVAACVLVLVFSDVRWLLRLKQRGAAKALTAVAPL